MEARIALYGAAQKQAEDARAQIRKQRDAVSKGFKKHEPEYEEVCTFLSCDGSLLVYTTSSLQYQKLMDRYIGEVDKILANMKKTTGAK